MKSFLKGIVVFPPVLTPGERRALLSVANQMSTELGLVGAPELPDRHSARGDRQAALEDIIDPEDERLVCEMRRALAKVAAALGEGADFDADAVVGAALDGAEVVMRGEIVVGNTGRLPALLPGFVFLVVLPLAGQDRALEISNRCAELVEQARLGGGPL